MYLLAYRNVNKWLALFFLGLYQLLQASDKKHLTAVCREKHTSRGCYGLTSTDLKNGARHGRHQVSRAGAQWCCALQDISTQITNTFRRALCRRDDAGAAICGSAEY